MDAAVPRVDLAFRLTGGRVPVDHGYALYAAISRLLPGIHADWELGIHPIRGRYIGGDAMQLSRSSRLTFRLRPDRIPPVLALTGKTLDVDGYRLAIGVPEVRPLYPSTALHSRLVTIKGFMEGQGFLDAARRQLVSLDVEASLRLGKRRTLRVKDKQVVGFELTVDHLDPQASLGLQAAGLGGRRHMGCGIFVGAPRWTAQ